MSLAFELPVEPPTQLRALTLLLYLAGAGSLVAAAALAWRGLDFADLSRAAGFALAVPALLVGLAVRFRRHWRAGLRGTLTVNAQGAAEWRADGAQVARPVSVIRWFCTFGLCWIELRVESRKALIVSGRVRCGDRVWAALNRWFSWLERGPRA
jgi:hypothetical protein